MISTSQGRNVASLDVSLPPVEGTVTVSCDIGLVRLSPQGRVVAVTVRQASFPEAELDSSKVGKTERVWLRVVDVASGSVVADELLYEPPLRYDWSRDDVLGLAWSDETTVQVAFVNLPEPIFGPDNVGAVNLDVYAIDDVLQLRTLHVPA